MNLPAEMAFVKLVSLGYNWNGIEWILVKDAEEQSQEEDEYGWMDWLCNITLPGTDVACPVPKGTKVDVQYRDGLKLYNMSALCSNTNHTRDTQAAFWWHDGAKNDIVAYRLSK
jgi:hypothetical protein